MELNEFERQLRLQRESFCLEEWVNRTLEDLQATDYVKCVECGIEKSPIEIHKQFQKRHEGICKRCWNFSEEEV